MKQIKDYLPLYLGCNVLYYNEVCKVFGTHETYCVIEYKYVMIMLSYVDFKAKLILRALSDMGVIERSKYEAVKDDEGKFGSIFYAEQCESPKAIVPFEDMTEIVNNLRIDGFDCDGLIQAGLAIDKTKIEQFKAKAT